MLYIIFIIYEDGSEYQSIIRNQKDIDRILLLSNNKGYEAIKICYYDDPKYCHVIYGKDNVFLHYYDDDEDDDGYLYYSAFNDPPKQDFASVILLKGIGKEKTFTESTKDLPIIFRGVLLSDDRFEEIRKKCMQWRRLEY